MTWSVGVVIPARNEQRRIKRCVRSVLEAIAACGIKQSWIVVAADSCTDDTIAVATGALSEQGFVLPCNVNSPGAARRLGANAVLEHFADVSRTSLWLANTDADSYVPVDWLQRQLRMADQGASAVAGVVKVDSFGANTPHGAQAFAHHYVTFQDGTHPHVHGANIALRADVYLDAGGWRDLSVGEDHCLWSRVRARGWPVCSSSASVVTTSGRLRGRARGGFADTLRMVLNGGAP